LPNPFPFPEKKYFSAITLISSTPGIYNNLTGKKMYNIKMLFMPHLPTPGAGVVDVTGRTGYGKSLNIWTIYIKWNFRLHCLANHSTAGCLNLVVISFLHGIA